MTSEERLALIDQMTEKVLRWKLEFDFVSDAAEQTKHFMTHKYNSAKISPKHEGYTVELMMLSALVALGELGYRLERDHS